jgi:hypothetical protein
MSRKPKPLTNGHCRIVLTGGPGGGKTTAGDLFRREMGDQVVMVPEAATMMFTGGFPRVNLPEAVHAAQRAIYHVQIHLEEAVMAQHPADPAVRSRHGGRRGLLAERTGGLL